jgi:hypothetical protein
LCGSRIATRQNSRACRAHHRAIFLKKYRRYRKQGCLNRDLGSRPKPKRVEDRFAHSRRRHDKSGRIPRGPIDNHFRLPILLGGRQFGMLQLYDVVNHKHRFDIRPVGPTRWCEEPPSRVDLRLDRWNSLAWFSQRKRQTRTRLPKEGQGPGYRRNETPSVLAKLFGLRFGFSRKQFFDPQ